MINPRLNDDLFKDFKEQQKFIEEQIKLFDPIAESLSRPAATRLINKGLLIVLELLSYAMTIGTIAFAVMMYKWKPFNVLGNLIYDIKISSSIGIDDLLLLKLAIYGLLGLIALLFFIMAQNLRSIRLKNNILHKAGKNMRTLVGQLLKRKAAIDTIQQRHFTELPTLGVNDVPNPGYDED